MPSTLLADDPLDFSEKFNTKLSDADEQKFQQWAQENNKLRDVYDYDIRGAWKEITSGTMQQADNGHLGDKYKKPNHPTFSTESMYSGKDGMVGGTWTEDADGNFAFKASKTNMKFRSPEEMQRYFQRVEPGVKLSIPQGMADDLYP